MAMSFSQPCAAPVARSLQISCLRSLSGNTGITRDLPSTLRTMSKYRDSLHMVNTVYYARVEGIV